MPINICEEYLSKARTNLKGFARETLGYKYNAGILDEILIPYLDYRYGKEKLPEGRESITKKIKDKLDIKFESRMIDSDFKYIYSWSSSFYELDDFVLKILSEMVEETLKNKVIKGKRKVKTLNDEQTNRFEQIVESIKVKGEIEELPELKDLVLEDIYERYILLTKESAFNEFVLKLYPVYSKPDKNEENILHKIKLSELKHNIEFPMIYSNEAIKQVYEIDDIVKEDKCQLIYYLLSCRIILDLINKKFNTKYIADFPVSIIDKIQKRQRLINIIQEENIQERIYLKIKFNEFKTHTEEVYSLLRQGYKFVLDLSYDETNEKIFLEDGDIQRIKIFEHIILTKENKFTDKLKQITDTLNSRIEKEFNILWV